MTRILALTGLAAALVVGANTVQAQERQGRGNFDPEEMRQRMMDMMRERLEVQGDAEWKIIEERIAKVNDARRQAGGGAFGAFGRGGFGGRPQRGGDDQGGGGQRGGQRARFGGDPLPEAEALQQALDSKASAEEIKAKLAKYREARKAKQAELVKAQDELRKVLSVRQEAVAVTMGLLD